ncbi:hypothetical protein F5146DRAFT_1165152 [Armillaria mellea]|nr:hypothetical protein F5146DRAFT_1165152 [Armillaria mellea]
MIPPLLYPLLCSYILQTLSLNITVPAQPHPLVNDNTSVLLTWSPDDPSHFFLTVERILSPDHNIASTPKTVENFYATRNETLVFQSAGNTSIEALKASPTEVGNVTFATSEPFQVDEGPTGDTPTSSTPDPDFSSRTSYATVSSTTSTLTASASATPAKHGSESAIIVGVICGTFLLALIATLLIWRRRKRRVLSPAGVFPTNLENDRQNIIWPYLKRSSTLRAFFHGERGYINHYPDVPPPPYSPLVTSE